MKDIYIHALIPGGHQISNRAQTVLLINNYIVTFGTEIDIYTGPSSQKV